MAPVPHAITAGPVEVTMSFSEVHIDTLSDPIAIIYWDTGLHFFKLNA